MKNSLKQPVLALLAIIPITLVFVISRFLFAFLSTPFDRFSNDTAYTVFVALQIALIGLCIWLVHRYKLPGYFVVTLLVSILLSLGIGPMN